MDQSPDSEATSSSARLERALIFSNPKVHYPNKNPPFVSSQPAESSPRRPILYFFFYPAFTTLYAF
jgi:hypothetical protein